MRQMPPWAETLVAKPTLEAMAEVFANPDASAAEDQMFRVQLLHAYTNVRYADPDTLEDPLLRLMVRLANENKYDLNLDEVTWVSLFSVLRDHTSNEFAMWVNQNHDEFWLDSDLPDIAPWVYRNSDGAIVDRFPHMNDAMANLTSSLAAANMQQVGLKKQGCYIATAVYGSYDAPPVLTLRQFRDRKLARTAYGRVMISAYYAVSPPLARRLQDATHANRFLRAVLDRVVASLDSHGYAAPSSLGCSSMPAAAHTTPTGGDRS